TYLYPVMLSISTGSYWFFSLVVIATVASAFLGLLLAQGSSYSFLGSLVMASLTALGGGVLRGLVVGRLPVSAIRSPAFFSIVLVTVFIGSLALRLVKIPAVRHWLGLKKWTPDQLLPLVDFCDALGLTALSIVGVMVALEVQVEPLYLWGPILGAI